VTTVVADPHEIANVAGERGIRFMYESSRKLPLRVELMAPSCVPATSMSTSGARLEAQDLALLRRDGIVHGLAEVMNFPGVIHDDQNLLAKLRAFDGKPIDGHAPAVSQQRLNAYVAAGIGSEHECVTVPEAFEKLSRGMYILIREATNARNLAALLPLITPADSRRICFCTDDRQPADLLGPGGVDYMLRYAIAHHVDPITAFRCCTLNPSEWFGLHDRGAIAPGRVADFFVFDDLQEPVAREVYSRGTPWTSMPRQPQQLALDSTCQIPDDLNLVVPARGGRIRVIGARADQLVTDHRVLDATVVDGHVVSDVSRDILKMAVVERHGGAGNVGIGFIQGIGLRRGAIAGTVAHDHHNLVVIGCDDHSMTAAARAIGRMGGGLVACDGSEVLAQLPLPVGGLMSDQPIDRVRDLYDALLSASARLGSTLHDPFMAMSFMALEVIPSLKLTDLGLVDVEQFRLVDLFV
jgi:adenine deaminase